MSMYSPVAFLTLLLLAIAGCTAEKQLAPSAPAADVPEEAVPKPTREVVGQDYRVLSIQDYDKALCQSVSIARNPDGFNVGLRVYATDRETGEFLVGRTYFLAGGATIGNESYLRCDERLNWNHTHTTISVFARGHSPVVFQFELPRNKLVTIEVPMRKSSEGGLSCIENLAKEFPEVSEEELEILEFFYARDFFQNIEVEFGLNATDYRLDLTECDMSRGGYQKARGLHSNATPFKLAYDWGWCSPGGIDCGASWCFSTPDDELFESVKQHVCGNLFTSEDRSKCLNGDYSSLEDFGKTIALRELIEFGANERTATVAKEKTDCLDDY